MLKLAMFGFTTIEADESSVIEMRNNNYCIYFTKESISKLYSLTTIRTLYKQRDNIVRYTYSDKDILKLLEDIQ